MQSKIQQPQRQDVEVLTSDPELGLTSEQAAHRAEAGWANIAPEGAGRTEQEIILSNILTFFNLVFVVLAVLLLVSGSSVKNCTFMVVVLCNAVIGCIQEIRAKRAVDKLTLVAKKPVRVIRDGVRIELRPEELVRDDIVEFGPGDSICADGVVRSGGLQVNESLITGESDEIEKHQGDSLLSGSFVVSGQAYARLEKVGRDSYISKLTIQATKSKKGEQSEMIRSLNYLIMVMGIIIIPIGIALFVQSFVYNGGTLKESITGMVAAIIGMIPEGLYLLASVAMAVSSVRLAR